MKKIRQGLISVKCISRMTQEVISTFISCPKRFTKDL